MSSDDQLDFDQLAPEIIAALRDVPPAGDGVREQQIASALRHLSVETRGLRRSWFGVAAASLVLVAGGIVAGRATTNSKSTFASASPGTSPTTAVAKGDLGTSQAIAPSCADRVVGQFIGSYSTKSRQWLMFVSGSSLDIVDSATCVVASRTPLPSIP